MSAGFHFMLRRRAWGLGRGCGETQREEWKEGMIQREMYFGRKCEVSRGQICGKRQTSGNCRTCCLCQRAHTPGPPPPTLYHMHPWLSQPASHQLRLPEGRKGGWKKRKKVAVKKGWEERANCRQERWMQDEPEHTGKRVMLELL